MVIRNVDAGYGDVSRATLWSSLYVHSRWRSSNCLLGSSAFVNKVLVFHSPIYIENSRGIFWHPELKDLFPKVRWFPKGISSWCLFSTAPLMDVFALPPTRENCCCRWMQPRPTCTLVADKQLAHSNSFEWPPMEEMLQQYSFNRLLNPYIFLFIPNNLYMVEVGVDTIKTRGAWDLINLDSRMESLFSRGSQQTFTKSLTPGAPQIWPHQP